MLVVSYATEGISFADRDKYPYFFATLGEFRQYEPVYTRMFQAFNWTQAVAYSEDGRKNTEYLIELESQLKRNDILLTSIKFWNDSTATKISSVSSAMGFFDRVAMELARSILKFDQWNLRCFIASFLDYVLHVCARVGVVITRLTGKIFQYHNC